MSATRPKNWWNRYKVVRWASVCALVGIASFLGVGLAPTPTLLIEKEMMPEETSPFVGNWEKISNSACSHKYPDRVEFQERGLYFGKSKQPGGFMQWDVGTYEVASPRRIKISTANDAIVTYQFSISDDVLILIDPDECKFEYRKVG